MLARKCNRCYEKTGFSLIEMALVLALVALIFSLSITNISMHQGMLMHAELNKLQAVCKMLQQQAYALNKQQQLFFDIESNSYRYDDYKQQLPHGIEFGFFQDVKGPPGSPLKQIIRAITFSNQCISFSPHGIIQSGTVYLKNERSRTMYALSSSVGHSSFLRKYMFDGSWKLIR